MRCAAVGFYFDAIISIPHLILFLFALCTLSSFRFDFLAKLRYPWSFLPVYIVFVPMHSPYHATHIHLQYSGRLPAAHELLTQSLERKPGDIDLLFQLGRAHEQGADYEMALQLGYGKVLMMEPTDCAALAKVIPIE